jgi:hypothetical protein
MESQTTGLDGPDADTVEGRGGIRRRSKARAGVHVDIHMLKRMPEANLPFLSKARLEALIKEAVVDA